MTNDDNNDKSHSYGYGHSQYVWQRRQKLKKMKIRQLARR